MKPTDHTPPLLPAKRERSAPNRVTGRLKEALDRMVWFGETYQDAGAAVELSARHMRRALGKPHVLAYLRAERATLRASDGPRNFHRLVELRSQNKNMNAAVQAARAIEGLADDEPPPGARVQAPGLVIVIQGGGADGNTRVVDMPSQRPRSDSAEAACEVLPPFRS
jgi:hypothetical protein